MKKLYIQPTLEILPFRAMTALCESGEGGASGSIGGGGDPEGLGRAPHRTAVF